MCDIPLKRDYNLTFEERPGYLFAKAVGPHDDLQIGIAMWHDIAERLEECKLPCVLVQEELLEAMTIVDSYLLVCEYAHTVIRDVRVAFVDTYPFGQDANKFGELVALNRGYHGKLFDTFEEGEEWLLSKRYD